MVNVRPQPGSLPAPASPAPREARFNVLLTEDRLHLGEEHWTCQLPRLLQPQGVASYIAYNGQEAIEMADQLVFHAAVVDLGTPVREPNALEAGGLWLLELMQRMPNRPPIVVINSPAYSQRQVQHLLRESLRLGAFSVLNKPIDLERLLAVFQKLLDRQYKGTWPLSPPKSPETPATKIRKEDA